MAFEDNDDEVLRTKLLLFGLGVWSRRENLKRKGWAITPNNNNHFAIVTANSAHGNGDYAFVDTRYRGWYNSEREAMLAALEAIIAGVPYKNSP